MKKFLLKLLIFAVLILVADYATGYLYRLYDRIHGGEIGKTHKVMTKVEPDLLILGSSRASHHYNPKILENSLGMSVYNAGFEGQGTLMAYGLLQGVKSRRHPRVILFEITPLFDIYEHPQSRSLNNLSPYISHYPLLKPLFYDVEPGDRFKLLSNAYRYNSKLLRILPNLIADRNDDKQGYNPMIGVIKTVNNSDDKEVKAVNMASDGSASTPQHKVDSVKTYYLQRLIDKSKAEGITLVFAVSPCLEPYKDEYYGRELDLAQKNGIPVLNHYSDTTIVNHPEYFSDHVHLNYRGADAYTRIISGELEDLIRR